MGSLNDIDPLVSLTNSPVPGRNHEEVFAVCTLQASLTLQILGCVLVIDCRVCSGLKRGLTPFSYKSSNASAGPLFDIAFFPKSRMELLHQSNFRDKHGTGV